jgi:hypothetical protein
MYVDRSAVLMRRRFFIFQGVFVPASVSFDVAEIPALFAQWPIIPRHQKAAMYHPLVLWMTLVDSSFVAMALAAAMYTVMWWGPSEVWGDLCAYL